MPFLALVLTLLASLQNGPTYSIAGEVRDGEGKPAAGVTIRAANSELPPHSQIHTAVSDGNGRFVLKLDGPGKYILVYDSRDHYLPQSIPFFRDPNNPPPQVVLTGEAPTAQVNISMSKNGVLSGQAIDAQTQLPVDHVTFSLCHAENRSVCWNTSRKSADGNFSIPAPFVPFNLRITSAEYEDWVGLMGNDPSTQISVPAGGNTSLRLLMKRKPEAMNRAISEAEKRAGINLPAPTPISPDDNQIFNIYPRVTRLEWSALDGAVSYSLEVDVCEFRRNTHQCINPQPLFLPANPSTSNIMSTSYEFRFVGAQPGRWRVWGVDKEGREGFKSGWRTFVYLK